MRHRNEDALLRNFNEIGGQCIQNAFEASLKMSFGARTTMRGIDLRVDFIKK